MRAEQPELLEEITERIRSVLAAYGIHQAALYGSVVQGDANASSDVDLLVELPEEKTLLDLVALK